MIMKLKDKYIVKSISYNQVKEWLLFKHYAKRIPSINYSFGLFIIKNKKLVGCCTYGIPASNNALLLCGKENKKYAIELNRLIKDDGLEKNLQSWFVSQTFKLLPKPLIILSYSDINNGHHGYTYQALNFIYTGYGGSSKEYYYNNKQYTSRHMNKTWFKKKGYEYNNNLTFDDNFKLLGGEVIKQKPKNRYIMFLGSKTQKKHFKNSLKWKILPYKKGDNKNYDTSYKTTTQIELF